MKNYNDMHYYRGDIYVRKSSSSDELVEQSALLQYGGHNNKFLWFDKGYPYVFYLFDETIRGIKDNIEHYNSEIDKYTLSTDVPSVDGTFYVKEGTLVEQKDMTKGVNFDLVREFDKHSGRGRK